MKTPITLRDIARRTRVSHVTVSNVLNRRDREGEVSNRVAARIRKVASRLGYVANHAARSLRLGRTQTVVLLVRAGLRHPYVHEQVEELQSELQQRGYHLNLELVRTVQDENNVLGALTRGRCDGVVVFSVNPQTAMRLRCLHQRGLPLVAIDPTPNLKFDCVDYDRVEAMRTAAAHLLRRGHVRVAVVLNEPAAGEAGIRPRLQLQGCREAFADAATAFDSALIIRWKVGANPARLWRRIQAARPRVTGIVCYNEQLAAGLTHAIRADGRRMPHDVALVTMGNSWLGELAEVPLTSVDLNHAAIARTVVDRLLKQMNHPQTPPRRILVKPILIARASSGERSGRDQ